MTDINGNSSIDYKAIAEWSQSGSAGASAKCIAAFMMGSKPDGSYPHDAGDFGRCETLLDAVPELRGRMSEMAEVNKYWAALAPRWEEIKASSEQSKLISSIVRRIEDADPNLIRMGNGATLRFGGQVL